MRLRCERGNLSGDSSAQLRFWGKCGDHGTTEVKEAKQQRSCECQVQKTGQINQQLQEEMLTLKKYGSTLQANQVPVFRL